MIRLLGSGRVGDVWLAQQRTRGGISRLVAVKILRDEWDENAEVVQRHKDEGQVLALLHHPSIVGFHEIAQIDGKLALVTEYVEGVNLAPYCTPGNLLPARVAVDVVGQVAAALDWALRTPNPSTGRPLNLVHRDVKPMNIQLSDQGGVKLLDFGLARSSEMKRHAQTRMGEVLGTAGYAAPEALAFQVQGPAGDVYSLGCTLFELLAGEPFFHEREIGEQARLALQSRDYGAFLESRLPAVPHPDLRILLEEMLAYAPERRPKAGTVCDACEDQVAQMDGPTFAEWNRARVAASSGPRAPMPAPAAREQPGLDPWMIGGVAAAAFAIFACGGAGLGFALWWTLGS